MDVLAIYYILTGYIVQTDIIIITECNLNLNYIILTVDTKYINQ